jgi:hypothetical protein
MVRSGFILILLLSGGQLTAQNLVTNGGFETFTTLPTAYAQNCYSLGWSSASGACGLTPGCGHPDYFHLAGAAAVRPPNLVFGTCMPHTGSAMMGFTPWYPTTANFREYPRFTLSSPLVPGQPYTVSFWTSNGTNPYVGWGCTNLGVAFTMAPITQSCGAPITTVTPQIEITTVVYSSTWMQHSFTFTPAQAFPYLSIGNFHTDAATAGTQMSPTGGMGAYYFIDDVVVQPATVLPIELVGFEARCLNEGGVELTWSTASESMNDHFEVERGDVALDYRTIGSVPGAWNSSGLLHYRFVDGERGTDTRYYRLRQVDGDGRSTWSGTRSVTCASNVPSLAIWPVPSSGDVHVAIASGTEGGTITVIDMRGALVRQERIGGDITGLTLSGLAPGAYSVLLRTGSGVLVSARCVVQGP